MKKRFTDEQIMTTKHHALAKKAKAQNQDENWWLRIGRVNRLGLVGAM
ncbi:hypothetical protein [Oleiagrimonas soli]|uniref:Uncharacterized protein n=1 Tax=Oleiagrimonas soli TaxID=1543381 RepID=A0A841KSM6_9GAMM|nr:hypothetical protein [Oleiagrimonas soli]MBB6184958.1 hypothetical protein [Oleiagrimonas soli]